MVAEASTTIPLSTEPALRRGLYAADEQQVLTDLICSAEAAIDAHRYADAVAALDGNHPSPTGFPDLALRALLAESWARMYLGEIQEALALLERARAIVDGPGWTDVARAEVLYRLGCCRLKLSSIGTAVSLFTLALELCDRACVSCDRLRAHILEWRSRCYQRQRDWEAARADVERALELAQGIGDLHTAAHVYFQASLVAEREGQWLLARYYAEQGKDLYERLDDRQNVGRLLNNLGGLYFLLGKPEEAITHLKTAFRVALEVDSKPDAAQAISSLAQVYLRTGEIELAEQQARQALELLSGRVDFLDEIGNAQLVLGRSLLEQGRHDEAEELIRAADQSFEQLSSVSHRAAAWVALGDLAVRRQDKDQAASLYRQAAEALQDFHF